MRLLILLLITFDSFPIDVYDHRGRLTQDYIALDFSSGDTPSDNNFKLPDGKEYKFLSFLGDGNNSNILKVLAEDGKQYALRLPKLNNDFLAITQEYYEILERYNVSIPKRYNFSNQYLLQEIIPHKFDLAHFLYNIDEKEFAEKEEVQKAHKALIQFSDDMARFEFIGDFDDTQLVYNHIQNKWVLLDWTNEAAIFHSESEEFIFDDPKFYRTNEREDLPTKALSILTNVKMRAFFFRDNLIKEDKKFYDKAGEPKTKQELITLLTHPWNSYDYKYSRIFTDYIVNHKTIFRELNFSNEEIERSIRFYNFINDDGYYLFAQQLQLSNNADEFISIVTETTYLPKILKAHLVYEQLDILLLQTPTVDKVRSLIMYMDKEMNEVTRARLIRYLETRSNQGCFSKLSSFKD